MFRKRWYLYEEPWSNKKKKKRTSFEWQWGGGWGWNLNTQREKLLEWCKLPSLYWFSENCISLFRVRNLWKTQMPQYNEEQAENSNSLRVETLVEISAKPLWPPTTDENSFLLHREKLVEICVLPSNRANPRCWRHRRHGAGTANGGLSSRIVSGPIWPWIDGLFHRPYLPVVTTSISRLSPALCAPSFQSHPRLSTVLAEGARTWMQRECSLFYGQRPLVGQCYIQGIWLGSCLGANEEPGHGAETFSFRQPLGHGGWVTDSQTRQWIYKVLSPFSTLSPLTLPEQTACKLLEFSPCTMDTVNQVLFFISCCFFLFCAFSSGASLVCQGERVYLFGG